MHKIYRELNIDVSPPRVITCVDIVSCVENSSTLALLRMTECCHPEALDEGSSQWITPLDSSLHSIPLRMTNRCHPELVSGSDKRMNTQSTLVRFRTKFGMTEKISYLIMEGTQRSEMGKYTCHPEALSEGSSQWITPLDSLLHSIPLRMTVCCHPELVLGSQERAPFAILRHAKNDEKCLSPRGRVPEGQEGLVKQDLPRRTVKHGKY